MKRITSKLLVLTVGLGLVSGNFAAAQTAADTLPDELAKKFTQAQVSTDQQDEKYVSETTLLIKYSQPLTALEHRNAGGTVLQQLSGLNYSIVTVKNKKNTPKVMAAYSKLGHVVSVTPSVQYKTLQTNDPKTGEQYFIDQLDLEKSQALAGNKPVTVAVIDQGIDSNHPDLKSRLLPSYNAVNPMNQGTPDFHGTHVAGIIAANKNNGSGGYGVNPNAKILPIDVFDRDWGASDYSIAQGILYAVEKGAKVINMSLGGPMKSPVIEEAVKKALEKNIVIVAAAGNTGEDSPSYPAAYEGVISVGSTNADKKLSFYSTFGPTIDVVAPGEDIYSTYYDYEKKSTYTKLSGTSMASPVVAGVASLLLAKNPQLTPTQIEYILEHTADDLGDAGFDTKYGNGLVNPVAALEYDLTKLPSFTVKKWSDKEIQANAQEVEVADGVTLKDNIAAPFVEKWYGTDVEAGEHLQFELEGAANYDYKLMLYLESPDGQERIDVNKVMEGKKEGKLFEAPYSGKLYFGVKDVNGSYDDSNKRLSHFSLSVKKIPVLPEDESSVENPIAIKLPYQTKNENYTLISSKGVEDKVDEDEVVEVDEGSEDEVVEADKVDEGSEDEVVETDKVEEGSEGEVEEVIKGDDDFFTFSVAKEQVVRIDLSAIPGVDTSIGVYEMNYLVPEDVPEEEKAAMINEMLTGDEAMMPSYFSNNGTTSEEEALTFVAYPETDYLLKVTNKSIGGYYDIIDFLMNSSLFDEEQEPESSAIPYKVSVKGKTLPPDEDNISLFGMEESTEESLIKELLGGGTDDEYLQTIKDGARSYQIGHQGAGYLQSFEDEDWFSVTPKETGIYEFNFPDVGKKEIPMLEVYQVQEDEDEDGKKVSYLSMIGSNFDFWTMKLANMHTGLKKDETYYVKVASSYIGNGMVSFDPYRFNSQLIVPNPQDPYEDNDKLEEVKDLPATSFEANFAMPNDIDAFYYEAKENQINGVSIQPQPVDPALKAKYPAELFDKFYGYIMIAEDKNKNRKVDDEEYEGAIYMAKTQASGVTTGSFKAEKDKNYVIMTTAYFESSLPLSLIPYKLTVEKANQDDEDKGSIVTNNVPSKPLKLTSSSNRLFEATGYLNAGVPYGDEDWYKVILLNDSKGQMTMSTGAEIDGAISIYTKTGKLMTSSDYYATGDQEILNFNLKKGIYYIKVKDIFGNASLTPYTLSVKY